MSELPSEKQESHLQGMRQERLGGGESDKSILTHSGKIIGQRSGRGFIQGRVRFIVNNHSEWQA